MKRLRRGCAAAAAPRPRASLKRRLARGMLACGLGVVLVAGLALGAAALLLARGPVSFTSLSERVAQGLEAQFGHGYDVDVGDASIGWGEGGPVLTVSSVTIRDAKGNLVVASPEAVIGYDPWSLGSGNLVPRDISFVGLELALTIAKDGTVSISAGGPLPARGAPARVTPSDTSFGPGAVLDALLASDGPVAVLERAGVREGSLRIDDQRRGSIVDYSEFGFNYRRGGDGEGRLSLAARGPWGPWSMAASIRGTPGAERSARLESSDLPLADLINLAQPGAIPLQTDMPLSGSVSVTVAADGAIRSLEGELSGGKSLLLLDDPDAEPIFVDSLSTQVGWDADNHSLLIRSLDFKSGETHWALTGSVTPPNADSDHWAFALKSDGSTLAGERPQDKTVRIDRLDVTGRMPIGMGALFVDDMRLSGPEVNITGSAAVGSAEGIDGLRLRLSASDMPVRQVLSFWPSFITDEIRTYFLDNVVSGTVTKFDLDDHLDAAALKQAFLKKPLPDESVHLEVAVRDGVMRPAPGLPTLSGIEASGVVTGRTATVAITRATAAPAAGRTLVLGHGSFRVADTTQKPAVAQIAFEVAGGADALIDTLRTDALRPFTAVPPELAGVKGQVEAKIQVTMPLQPVLGPKDVALQIQGSVVGLSGDGIAGKDHMEGGNLAFTQDRDGLAIKGDARIGGIPVQIESSQAAGQPMDTVITTTLDEAARAKKGIKLPGQVTGPIDARITLHDAAKDAARDASKDSGKDLGKAQMRVELDLTKAALADVVPGWTKPAGKAAKASFRYGTDGDATTLEDFTLDAAGGISARGTLKLAADQSLSSAHFSTLKLSPSDDIRLDLDRQGSLTKAVLRGAAFDARPLLRALTTPGNGTLSNPGDIDIDARIGSVTGLNGEVLSAADLRLGLRGGEFRDFRLSARFGASPVSGQTARLERGGAGVVIESGDAGSFLRFFDIYRRMLGGTLLVTLAGPSPLMEGTIAVNRFVLSNEPALAKSAPVAPPASSLVTDRSAAVGETPNNVEFTKLRAGFSVGGGKLVIRDGTMWGQQVGGTLDGSLDFRTDQANLSGTFVPAYGLNNMINQVPVVGPILGGGKNEGLFAVNFRISGKVSQPTLSINPLSAVAPGILRKFFGVFTPEQTGSTPPRELRSPPDR